MKIKDQSLTPYYTLTKGLKPDCKVKAKRFKNHIFISLILY